MINRKMIWGYSVNWTSNNYDMCLLAKSVSQLVKNYLLLCIHLLFIEKPTALHMYGQILRHRNMRPITGFYVKEDVENKQHLLTGLFLFDLMADCANDRQMQRFKVATSGSSVSWYPDSLIDFSNKIYLTVLSVGYILQSIVTNGSY